MVSLMLNIIYIVGAALEIIISRCISLWTRSAISIFRTKLQLNTKQRCRLTLIAPQ